MEHVNIAIRVINKPGEEHSYIVSASTTSKHHVIKLGAFDLSLETRQSVEPSLDDLKARDAGTIRDHARQICDFGKRLFNCLINGEVRAFYDSKKREAETSGKILRLELTLVPLELVILPWEILYDERDSEYLCLIKKPKIVLVRCIDKPVTGPVKRSTRRQNDYAPPLRILGMISDPRDQEPLDVEKEKNTIEQALQQLEVDKKVTLTWGKSGRHSELVDLKNGGERWDVFHFIGHGRFDKEHQQGQLAFEKEEKRAETNYISANRLALPETTKLVVLNACETARGNPFDRLSNIAHSLASNGISAVVAMQFKILDSASNQFAKTFYTLLAAGKTIEEAVIEARSDIYSTTEDPYRLDWAAPILYVSSTNVLSFQQISKQRATPQLPPVEPPEDSPVRPSSIDILPLPISPSDEPSEEKAGESDGPHPRSRPIVRMIRKAPLWLRIGVLFALVALVGSFFLAQGVIWPPSPGGSGCTSSASYIIGTDFPTSEGDASAAKYGADLAISQNRDLGQGATLGACDKDDAIGIPSVHNPDLGAQNIRQFVSDSRVLGVVGPENSNVALAEIPIAVSAGLVMVSPSTTNPCLTLPNYCASQGLSPNQVHPTGKANTFFRLPGNDLRQGDADANLLKSLNKSLVCVVDDKEVYGRELADAFSTHLRDNGGRVLGGRFQISAQYTSDQLSNIAAQIVTLRPQAVFYGGSVSNKPGLLKEQLALKGFTGFFVGGDGIGANRQFLSDARSYANNTYATSLGPDPSTLPPSFTNTYLKAYGVPPTARSALGYDAAMALITAIRSAIKPSTQITRSDVLRNMPTPAQSYNGYTGAITFDNNGDNSGPKIFSVYAAEQGQWVYKKEYTVTLSS